MNFSTLFLIGLGGFTGAILRYLTSSASQSWMGAQSGFPYGTLTVNIVGCLLMGFLSYLATAHYLLSQEMRHFVLVGFLGSYTTFSTFGNDTMTLFQSNQTVSSFIYLGAHLLFGIGAVWIGQTLAVKLGNT